jgi:hypothetical protein
VNVDLAETWFAVPQLCFTHLRELTFIRHYGKSKFPLDVSHFDECFPMLQSLQCPQWTDDVLLCSPSLTSLVVDLRELHFYFHKQFGDLPKLDALVLNGGAGNVMMDTLWINQKMASLRKLSLQNILQLRNVHHSQPCPKIEDFSCSSSVWSQELADLLPNVKRLWLQNYGKDRHGVTTLPAEIETLEVDAMYFLTRFVPKSCEQVKRLRIGRWSDKTFSTLFNFSSLTSLAVRASKKTVLDKIRASLPLHCFFSNDCADV